MKNYVSFYKNFGIRTPQMLSNPQPRVVEELSKGAILHLPAEEDKDFPDTSITFLSRLSNRAYLYNELEMSQDNHAIGSIRVQKENIVRQWLMENKKKFQGTSKPISAITEENQLVVVNYGLVDNGMKYKKDFKLTFYHRWFDVQKTMWAKINDIASTTNRMNFVLVKTGTELPSRASLKQASKGMEASRSILFDTEFKLNILDLWSFIDPETSPNSAMGLLDKKNYPKVCLLFQLNDGRSLILNLGYLNSWIKGEESQIEGVSSPPQKSIEQIQIILLQFLLSVQNLNIEGLKSDRESEEEKEDDRLDLDGDSRESVEPSGEDASEGLTKIGKEKIEGKYDSSDFGTRKELSKLNKGIFHKTREDEDDQGDLIDESTTLEDEMRLLEEMENRKLKAHGVSENGEEDERGYDPDITLSKEEIISSINKPPEFGENITKQINQMVDRGSISAVEYRRTIKALEEFKSRPNPFTGEGNIIEATKVEDKDLAFNPTAVTLKDPLGVAGESLQSSCIEEMDRSYIKNVFKKEILGSAIAITNMNVIINDIEAAVKETAEGKKGYLYMHVKSLGGKPSILRHEFPMPDEDGTFMAKGVRYHSRKQISDVNFGKKRGDEVGLGSFTSKLFIRRTRSKARNTTAYIEKHLTRAQLGEISNITKVRPANVYDSEFQSPYLYSSLSEHFKGFIVKHKLFGDITLDFESRTRETLIDKETMTSVETGGNILCGKSDKGLPIYITPKNEFFVRTKNGDEPLGNVFELLDLDETKSPVEYTEIDILGKSIPTGLVLGRQIGFKKLLKMSGVTYRTSDKRSVALEPHEFRVRFKDISFIFSKRDKLACNLFGGFEHNNDSIKNYPASSFENPEVYDAILESNGLNLMYAREIENLTNGFVDPITRRRLKSLGEPETFLGLLYKSNEVLTTNSAPEPQDADSQQILGYERFAGALYREMYVAIRSFRNRNVTGRSKIDMSHYAVWQSIMSDGTIKTCEDINPINNLKMHESLTFAGAGGRSRETFNLPARAFNKKAPGLHSEASVDSGDVAYNLFLPWNPTIGDLNGRRVEKDKLGYGNLLSTSLNLTVGPNHNDMKRNVFTSIQNSHTIACKDYEPVRVLAGPETLVGQRTDDLFCKVAKGPGKVVSITERGIIVEYEDKTREGVALGRMYGDSEGSTYPHDLVTNLKVGDKVNKGETIAYNTGFFEPLSLNPKFSILKFGVYANVAFMELPETHEDSCAITPELADKLETKKTDPRSYVVRFGQNLHQVLSVGSKTDPDTVLMVIEDEISSGTGIFDPKSTTTLGRLGRDAPRAGHTGVLDTIEVFYHGDKADMSPSLRKLADASDRRRSEQLRASNKTVTTGRVTSDWSVSGNPLQLNTAEIIFKVTTNQKMANADKLVFAEQLKSTVGKIETRKITTVSGRKVDAVFGGSSVIKRITLVPINTGSTVRIMDDGKEKALEAYFG